MSRSPQLAVVLAACAVLPFVVAAGCAEESLPHGSDDTAEEADTNGVAEGSLADFTLPAWTDVQANCIHSPSAENLQAVAANSGLLTLRWGDVAWRTTHPERRVAACERVERSLYGEGQVTLSNGDETSAILRMSGVTLADTMNVLPMDEMTSGTLQLAVVSRLASGGCAQNVEGPTCYTVVPDDLQMVATYEVLQAGEQRILNLTPVLLSAEADGVWFSSAVYQCAGFETVLSLGPRVVASDGRTAVPVEMSWEDAVESLRTTWNDAEPAEPSAEPVEVDWDPERGVIPGDHWCGSNRCCDADGPDTPASATVPCDQQLDCAAWNYVCLLMPDSRQTCWDTDWIPRCTTDTDCGDASFLCSPLPDGERGCIDRSSWVN